MELRGHSYEYKGTKDGGVRATADIMDELREKCPWDREQTNESLRANTIEETYELSEAILSDDNDEIKKELGDLAAARGVLFEDWRREGGV